MSGATGRLGRTKGRLRLPLILVMLAGLLAPGAAAGEPDAALVERGRDLAVEKCGRCHAIDRTDEPPHDITPPFRELHARFPIAMLEEAKDSGSIAGHDEMPGFDMEAEEIRALLAYIDSLSPPGSPRYLDGNSR